MFCVKFIIFLTAFLFCIIALIQEKQRIELLREILWEIKKNATRQPKKTSKNIR